jgi:hypothetical protein
MEISCLMITLSQVIAPIPLAHQLRLDRAMEALMAAGIPRHLFKILTSNDDIDLKPVTQYLKAV